MTTIPNIPLMREILSSAPVEYFIIPAIRISIAGQEPICLCHAYRDYDFELDDEIVSFTGGQFTIQEPKRDTTGAQTLSFGFAGVSIQASDLIRVALETKAPVFVELFNFIEHQGGTHQLGNRLRPMELLKSSIEGDVATFQARYFGILDLKFPRDVYNSENAPGILYV